MPVQMNVRGMKTRAHPLLLNGHLDVLQWARANGCPWKEGTCSAAAGGGHLECVAVGQGKRMSVG